MRKGLFRVSQRWGCSSLSTEVGELRLEITTLSSHDTSNALNKLLSTVKRQTVLFTAPDIYSICCTVNQQDNPLKLAKDGDFMRAVGDSFNSCDQSVLNPFQLNFITQTLKKTGVLVSLAPVAVSEEEEAITPPSLIAVLKHMSLNNARDERQMKKVVVEMNKILTEFTVTELLDALRELSQLKCDDAFFVEKLVKLVLRKEEEEDEPLTTIDISGMLYRLAEIRGVRPATLRSLLKRLELDSDRMEQQDYRNALGAILKLGDIYNKEFVVFVDKALDKVENLDCTTVLLFLKLFTVFEYRNREHIEIYADAIIDQLHDLKQFELVEAFVAMQELNLMNEAVFDSFINALSTYAPTLAVSLIPSVVDVCSRVPYDSTQLMDAILNRITECVLYFNPTQLANVIEGIGEYPPAKERDILVQTLGRQCFLRFEIMNQENSIPKAVHGLSQLGYTETEFYLKAATEMLRFGIRNFYFLEPLLVGLSGNSDKVPPPTLKMLSSHLSHLSKTLTLQEVQRAYRYAVVLRMEDDYVYRSLARRVLHFVKEINSDVPEDIQMLIQRGSMSTRT